MPVYYRNDDKPVVELDPRLELSPFTLFRRLREGKPPMLVDIRRDPSGSTLSGSQLIPDDDWCPPADTEVVLFDDDGVTAVKEAHRLQQQGYSEVRALFGGLQLYAFALDAEVVGQETHLVPIRDRDE